MKWVRFMKAHGPPQHSCRADQNVNNAHAEAATPQFIPHTPAWQALEGSVCVVWGEEGQRRGYRARLCVAGEAGMQFCLSSLGVITLSSSGAACLRGLAEPNLMNKQQAAGQRIPLLLRDCAAKARCVFKTFNTGYTEPIQ